MLFLLGMRVLILSHRVPFPLNDGGALVAHAFIEALIAKGVEVHLLSFNTTKHFVAEDVVSKEFSDIHTVKLIPLDNKVTTFGALANLLFSKESYNYTRFNSKLFQQELIQHLSSIEFDIVHLENIYLGHYVDTIRKYSHAKITIRIHNIEYLIWQRQAFKSSGFKSAYLKRMSNRLKHDELSVLNKCDYMLALQGGELKMLNDMGVTTKGAYLPFGIEPPMPNNKIVVEPNSVFHIASMNWLPNIEAVDWLLQEVWPIVLQLNGNAKLHLAGKQMPDKYFKLNLPSVHVHRYVANQYEFMQQYHTMVVPLLSGAGIRVKIIEALTLGKPLVTTKLGVDGIEVQGLDAVRIADDAALFAQAIVESLALHTSSHSIQAQQQMAELYNKENIANELYAYLSRLTHAKA